MIAEKQTSADLNWQASRAAVGSMRFYDTVGMKPVALDHSELMLSPRSNDTISTNTYLPEKFQRQFHINGHTYFFLGTGTKCIYSHVNFISQ